jgi:hypothetical protein
MKIFKFVLTQYKLAIFIKFEKNINKSNISYVKCQTIVNSVNKSKLGGLIGFVILKIITS